MPDRRFITWNIYDIVIKKIVKQIKQAGKTYEAIGTFPWNGYIPAVHLAKLLNINMIYNLNDYTRAEKFRMINLLIVDDISDTGKTLEFNGVHDVACVAFKKGTAVKPTYDCLEFRDDEWVVFPWELKNAIMRRDRNIEKKIN